MRTTFSATEKKKSNKTPFYIREVRFAAGYICTQKSVSQDSANWEERKQMFPFFLFTNFPSPIMHSDSQEFHKQIAEPCRVFLTPAAHNQFNGIEGLKLDQFLITEEKRIMLRLQCLRCQKAACNHFFFPSKERHRLAFIDSPLAKCLWLVNIYLPLYFCLQINNTQHSLVTHCPEEMAGGQNGGKLRRSI